MQENNLFVGGLSWGTSDDTLMTAFSQAGTVKSAKVIMDKETGKSRGFGFVEMGSDEEAQAAIKMFDGQEIDGRKVGVNVARPRND